MSATVVGGAVSQWPFGRLSDRIDRRLMLMISCIAASASGVAVVLAGMYAPSLVIPAGFLFGVFSFPVYALSVAHANDVARGAEFVAVAGGLLMVTGLASRSEEHTSEIQSLMRHSYAGFCFKKKR